MSDPEHPPIDGLPAGYTGYWYVGAVSGLTIAKVFHGERCVTAGPLRVGEQPLDAALRWISEDAA